MFFIVTKCNKKLGVFWFRENLAVRWGVSVNKIAPGI
jgi:hypothetical protein